MNKHALAWCMMAVSLTITACSKEGGGAGGNKPAQTPAAQKVAGNKTIASGLAQDSKFIAAAKTAGIDQTLAGPGPYTVLVPDDAAFNSAPAGTFDSNPQNRARVTSVLTNLILPGTVLVADIEKAIENGKGKAPLATMGGSTLTATKEGGKTVLTDSAGHKATITQGDQQFTNGVVHHINAVPLPSEQQANAPAVGQKAGQ